MDDTEIPDAGSANDPDESDPQFSSSRQNFPLSPIDQQWLSLYILTQRDRPICSLQAMKEFLDMPDDLATAARIEELNEQYEEDLERLYMAQAEEYMDEAEDRYYSYQEASQSGQLEEAYANWRKEDGDRQLMWRHATELTHHAYQSRLSKLSETPPTNSDFPQSIDEYRLKPKETQHRIARFLLLETEDQRDKMLTEFGWAWRQVTPLKDEFQANIVGVPRGAAGFHGRATTCGRSQEAVILLAQLPVYISYLLHRAGIQPTHSNSHASPSNSWTSWRKLAAFMRSFLLFQSHRRRQNLQERQTP